MQRFIILLSAMVFLAISQASIAVANGWTVANVQQSARYTLDNKQWFQINPGANLPMDSWIHVGKDANLRLVRGEETIMLRANSLVQLTQTKDDVNTELMQHSGSVIVDVLKRDRPHLTVNTPYLSAVVKGTKFAVSSNSQFSIVFVEQGLVGVEDLIRKESADLAAGQSAKSSGDLQETFEVGINYATMESALVAASGQLGSEEEIREELSTLDKPDNDQSSFIDPNNITLSNAILGGSLFFALIIALIAAVRTIRRKQ